MVAENGSDHRSCADELDGAAYRAVHTCHNGGQPVQRLAVAEPVGDHLAPCIVGKFVERRTQGGGSSGGVRGWMPFDGRMGRSKVSPTPWSRGAVEWPCRGSRVCSRRA